MTEGADTRVRLLGELLAECDEPCPACAYNLRGLTGEACPECGEALLLRVGVVEPRLGLFIAGLVVLAAGAGVHAFVVVSLVLTMMRRGGYDGAVKAAPLVTLGSLTACVLSMFGWVWVRIWIRQLAPAWRAGLLLLCWVLPIGTVVVIFRLRY